MYMKSENYLTTLKDHPCQVYTISWKWQTDL